MQKPSIVKVKSIHFGKDHKTSEMTTEFLYSEEQNDHNEDYIKTSTQFRKQDSNAESSLRKRRQTNIGPLKIEEVEDEYDQEDDRFEKKNKKRRAKALWRKLRNILLGIKYFS